MGADGIHILVLKALTKSHYFVEAITDLFHIYAATSLVPSQWSDCNLHLLIKDSSKPPTVENTRPIALSSVLRRIFESLVLRKWTNLNQPWTHLNYGQAGFRRGYSTLSHLVLSDELSRHGSVCSIFLDIKSAFDGVPWHVLNDVLLRRECPSSTRNLILSLTCKPASLHLSVNQSERTLIQTSKGVFQGGGISAFVFAIYIDPLATALNGNTPSHYPAGLLFADDIQHKPRSIEEAQHLLDICMEFSLRLQFTWNINKCAVVARYPLELTLGNALLPNANSYRYLGAIHRFNRVDWEATITASIEKQRRFINSLEHSSWHPRQKLVIYRTFIRPITEYVLPLVWIWIKRNPSQRRHVLKLLNSCHKDGMKFIFGRACHTEVMDFMCGLGNLEFRAECLVGGLNASFLRLKRFNPLVLARSVYCVSTSNHFLLQHCFNSQFLSEYSKKKKLNLDLTWKTWKRYKLEDIRCKKAQVSPLIAYYMPNKRMLDNSSLAFDLPIASFRIVCNWRFNRFLNYRTCQCGHKFNRSHISCYLPGSSLYDSHFSSPSFQRSVKNLLTLASKIKNYGVLDFILNLSSYTDFLSLFDQLQRLLDC
jgi:hypothetical protein